MQRIKIIHEHHGNRKISTMHVRMSLSTWRFRSTTTINRGYEWLTGDSPSRMRKIANVNLVKLPARLSVGDAAYDLWRFLRRDLRRKSPVLFVTARDRKVTWTFISQEFSSSVCDPRRSRRFAFHARQEGARVRSHWPVKGRVSSTSGAIAMDANVGRCKSSGITYK